MRAFRATCASGAVEGAAKVGGEWTCERRAWHRMRHDGGGKSLAEIRREWEHPGRAAPTLPQDASVAAEAPKLPPRRPTRPWTA